MPPLKKTGPRATGTASNWRKLDHDTGSTIPTRDTATTHIFAAKERTATIISIAGCLSDHTTKRGGQWIGGISLLKKLPKDSLD